MTKREERIRHYEEIYDRASALLRKMEEDLDGYVSLKKDLEDLEAYYTDGRWKRDYIADEEGKLPPGLKRGVLSEDGLWDLLNGFDELREDCLIVMAGREEEEDE